MKARSFVNKRYSALLGIFVLTVGLVTTGQICAGGSDLPAPEPVTITIWRTEDQRGDFEAAMGAYSAVYPHVSFDFRTFKEEEYEDELFSAWSKGEGPDIFSVPNWRLGKFREFTTPMPQTATLRRALTETSWGREIITVEENIVQFPGETRILDLYPQAVASDVLYKSQVYGLPYSMDTLAMYYNRNLLASAQIAVPPTNWEEFRNSVQAITVLDDERNIIQPAAALGTADNIANFFDIVSIIMMQNGAPMADNSTRALFSVETEDGRLPGIEAIDFYTKFSDPTFRTFTWDDTQLNALEAFTQGTLAFYFGYYSEREIIEQRAPNLGFSYTKIPQIDTGNPVNYANYMVEAVHIGSANPEHAWNFINFTAGQEQNSIFLQATGRTPALKALIGEKQQDSEVGIFAQQALTAKSWYHGVDPDAAMLAFQEMINEAVAKSATLQEIVNLAERKVSITMQNQ
ncbi:ABC transporter substrate-binding protein [Patescibacteria group bacterium]